MLPQGLSGEIDKSKIDTPYIFDLLKKWTNLDEKEMYSTFNMGVGMIVIVSQEDAEDVEDFLRDKDEKIYKLGRVVKGDEGVILC